VESRRIPIFGDILTYRFAAQIFFLIADKFSLEKMLSISSKTFLEVSDDVLSRNFFATFSTELEFASNSAIYRYLGTIFFTALAHETGRKTFFLSRT
jgi:hypothetical protein